MDPNWERKADGGLGKKKHLYEEGWTLVTD